MDTFLPETAPGYRRRTTLINGWAFAQRQELSGGAACGGIGFEFKDARERLKA